MKIGILIFGLVLSLSLVACGSTNDNNMKIQELPKVSDTTNEMNNNSSDEVIGSTQESSEKEALVEVEKGNMTVFNKESLAEFNGKDGKPGYVAVNGVVYDVSNVAAWQTPHAGRFEPGKDYSTEIGESPHGLKNLENLEVMGTYED